MVLIKCKCGNSFNFNDSRVVRKTEGQKIAVSCPNCQTDLNIDLVYYLECLAIHNLQSETKAYMLPDEAILKIETSI